MISRAGCSAGLVLLVACGGTSGGDGGVDEGSAAERRAFLRGVARRVIVPTYTSFVEATAALESAAGAFADNPTDEARTEAQDAFGEAMDVWQFAEAFQLGPAGSMGVVAGGEDLRDQIYSWPLVNRCRIDQETVASGFSDPEAFAEEPINVRGLAALEYLLFYLDGDNGCSPESKINAGDPSMWDAIGDELVTRRAAYARAAAADLHARAQELLDAWESTGEDFLSELAAAGESSRVYETAQLGIDEMVAALLYIDAMVKDMKVGDPAGINDTCALDVCPDEQESRYADRSKKNIAQNIAGFSAIATGGDDGSVIDALDELLAASDRADVGVDLVRATETAARAVEDIQGSFGSALSEDAAAVASLYTALQDVTDLMKSDVTTVLDVEPLASGPADND